MVFSASSGYPRIFPSGLTRVFFPWRNDRCLSVGTKQFEYKTLLKFLFAPDRIHGQPKNNKSDVLRAPVCVLNWGKSDSLSKIHKLSVSDSLTISKRFQLTLSHWLRLKIFMSLLSTGVDVNSVMNGLWLSILKIDIPRETNISSKR